MKIGHWTIDIGTMWKGDLDNPKREWRQLELDMVYCECPQWDDPKANCTCGDEIAHIITFYWPRLHLSHIVIPIRAVMEQDS